MAFVRPVLAGTPAAQASGPGRRGSARPREATLPLATDLASDGREADRARIPILLFFDRLDCPYCERALREYLVPMSREAPSSVVFRRIEIDATTALVDFAGRRTTHAEFASRCGVVLSPTIQMVDAGGRPLGEPLVGLSSPDFYGAYLDRTVDEARLAMRGAADPAARPPARTDGGGTSR